MIEDALDHRGILDARYHPELPAAASARVDLDGENAFEPLCPGHRGECSA
jgi:hypothetical protein